VRLLGERPVPSKLHGRVGYLFQNPERQLFEDTVFDEVAFPLRRLGLVPDAIEARVSRVLTACGLEAMAQRSPHLLSCVVPTVTVRVRCRMRMMPCP